jgi:hypothetical protein
MTLSLRQRIANRRNGRRSQGPKSLEGKLRSSQNSIKHGLSSKIDADRFGVAFSKIKEILIEEGLSPSNADDLALRILDLERNLDFQRVIFQRDRRSPMTLQTERDQALRNQFPETDDLIERLSGIPDGIFSLTPEDTREGRKLFDQAKRFLIRVEKQREAREKRSSVRYLTRSANQLGKALKRL